MLFLLATTAMAAPLMTTLVLPDAPVVTSLMPEFAVPNGGVYFDRTINTIQHLTGSVSFDKGCTASDPYGSNKCTWNWKDAITVAYQGALQEDITSGKLVVDLKINNVIPFSFSCPLCGANCTFEIPIIKKPETIKMPPCPIKAANIPATKTPFTLPDKNPLGIGASVAGTVQIADQSGGVIFKITVDAKVS